MKNRVQFFRRDSFYKKCLFSLIIARYEPNYEKWKSIAIISEELGEKSKISFHRNFLNFQNWKLFVITSFFLCPRVLLDGEIWLLFHTGDSVHNIFSK